MSDGSTRSCLVSLTERINGRVRQKAQDPVKIHKEVCETSHHPTSVSGGDEYDSNIRQVFLHYPFLHKVIPLFVEQANRPFSN
jgi:hypothetical protein